MSINYPSPLPATMARRLAEAADGFRNIDKVYFVVGYEFPHPIKKFSDLASAESYAVKKKSEGINCDVFGPYKSNDDFKNLNIRSITDIVKVEMQIHFSDGEVQHEILQGNVDSIFLNLSSFEKFVFPYYCHLYGVEYAKKMRDNLLNQYETGSKNTNNDISLKIYKHAPLTLMLPLNQGEELP